MVYCYGCHSIAAVRISWTVYNPGRRFHCCSKRGSNCGFVDWYDSPMRKRSVHIILGLLRSMNDLHARVTRNEVESRRLKFEVGVVGVKACLYLPLNTSQILE
ncbi:zinc finger, GRF-type containing protein [Tanacetum coccineum]